MNSAAFDPASILITTDAVGGVWTYSLALAEGFSAFGVRCVLTTLGPQPEPAQRAAAARIAGLSLIETDLPLDWLTDQSSELHRAAGALHTIARREHVDTVHLHAPAFCAGAWPVPVVAVAHSCVATWWDAVRVGPLPPALARRAAATAEGITRADAVIAPTHAFAQALQRVYGASRRIDVVHNGLPPGHALHAADRRGVLAAGRLWDDAKGMATLDEAAERLSATVLAAGPLHGPAGAQFTPRHLRPLGVLNASALRGLMAKAAIFAAPSHYEPFGLAVLEAAQCATPLILADIPTFRELWQDVALFVPPGDAIRWHDALAALLADASWREGLGASAAQRAAHFTAQAMANATLAVHRRCTHYAVAV